MTTDDERRLGEIIDGKYELLEILGSGGMGTVYKAWHTLLEATAAVKLLKAVPGQGHSTSRQMLKEAQAAAKVRHPNVVSVTDVSHTAHGEVFIVMEHVDGENLEQVLEREGPLEVARSRSLLLQIASGLRAAHTQGVVHRDVKPANCMVGKTAEDSEVIKILDFGIAKVLEDSNETSKVDPSTRPCFTRRYAAPEVKHGSTSSARSDIYSLGVLAYRMLTGCYPHGEAVELIPAEQLRSDLPRDLCQLLRDMLEHSPSDRPPAMDDVCRRLRLLEEDPRPGSSFGGRTNPEGESPDTLPEQTEPQGAPAASVRPRTSRWGLFGLSLGALGVTITALLVSSPPVVKTAERPPQTIVLQQAPDPELEQRLEQLEQERRREEPEEEKEPEPPIEAESTGTGAPEPVEEPTRDHRSGKPTTPPRNLARTLVRSCLKKACVPAGRSSKEPVSLTFSVYEGQVTNPEVEPSTREAHDCLFQALLECRVSRLPDDEYHMKLEI